MEVENPGTLEQALFTGVNLFLGAGFSVLAQDKFGIPLPVGLALANELREKFNLQGSDGLDLPQLCTLISFTEADALREFLLARFTIGSFDQRYHILDQIEIKTIFTTNIDDLAHRIYAPSILKYLNDMNFNGPSFNDRQAVEFVTLHGSVLDSARPLRFGTLDLAEAFTIDPDRWRYLQVRLSRFPTIFWGYSLRDAGTLQTLAAAARTSNQLNDLWIVTHPTGADKRTLAYYKALNFHIILGETADVLGYLERASSTRAAQSPQKTRNTHTLFSKEAIPDIGSWPPRPIRDFFMGSPPEWSDVFSKLLHRTEHYQHVRELINQRRNVLVIGSPVSGKSTLLMQPAAEISFKGHKIITSVVSSERASWLVRQLQGEPALIFIDNCIDNIDALDQFARVGNIQLVGADRDYNLFTVLHRLDSKTFEIADVTELSRADIQACVAAIPEDMRRIPYMYPKVTEGTEPSLYEIIAANVHAPTLTERFSSILKDLRSRAPEVAELIIFISYVHKSHTPVSMDMLMGYWYGKPYQEVYNLVERAGASLAEYAGQFSDEKQDFFAVRSDLVADTILNLATAEELRKILIRFHEGVSTIRISNYDIFRRRAYDADLFVRAFGFAKDGRDMWEEGRAFYYTLYRKDPSPYTLQQAALYLSRKKRHAEAFQMIDQAIAEAGQHNWSIRNSHAIILFRANINFARTPIKSRESESLARESLDKSMDIVTQCYKSDRRKPFHALTFADHSVQYWDKYHDGKARQYLETARTWLEEGKREAGWIKGYDRLKRLIDQSLRSGLTTN